MNRIITLGGIEARIGFSRDEHGWWRAEFDGRHLTSWNRTDPRWAVVCEATYYLLELFAEKNGGQIAVSADGLRLLANKVYHLVCEAESKL